MAIIRTSKINLSIISDETPLFIFQPDDDALHPGVVLIQEWWGIDPHIQDLAQKLAEEGFVVALPDLYHGKLATEPDDAMRMMILLEDNIERAIQEIKGALEAVKDMSNVEPKKLGLMGFCLGGLLTYRVVAHSLGLAAAVSFYGSSYNPTPEEVASVDTSILAIYGRQDESIPAQQIQRIERLYKDAGKDITVKIYDAGHAFINPSHGMGNEQAAAEAWSLAMNFLKEKLG